MIWLCEWISNMELGDLSSYLAFFVSLLALMFTRRSWFESNRPIVTAEIVTHAAGNISADFSLEIHNVGNRPATYVTLSAKEPDIEKICSENAEPKLKSQVFKCFRNNGLIPLLNHGKSAKNGFGVVSKMPEHNVLKYGSKLPILIRYRDLNGRSYKSKITLVVKSSEFFAGSGWKAINE